MRLPLNDERLLELLSAWGVPSAVELRSHFGGALLSIGEVGECASPNVSVVDLQSDDPSSTSQPDVPHGFASLEAMSIRAVFLMHGGSQVRPPIVERVAVDVIHGQFPARFHEHSVEVGAVRIPKDVGAPRPASYCMPLMGGHERDIYRVEEDADANRAICREQRKRRDLSFSGNEVWSLLSKDRFHSSDFAKLATVGVAQAEPQARNRSLASAEGTGH